MLCSARLERQLKKGGFKRFTLALSLTQMRNTRRVAKPLRASCATRNAQTTASRQWQPTRSAVRAHTHHSTKVHTEPQPPSPPPPQQQQQQQAAVQPQLPTPVAAAVAASPPPPPPPPPAATAVTGSEVGLLSPRPSFLGDIANFNRSASLRHAETVDRSSPMTTRDTPAEPTDGLAGALFAVAFTLVLSALP